MRTLLGLGLVGLLLGAADPADDIKKEMALLEGTWSMVSGEKEGEKLPEDLLKDAKRSVTGGVTTISIGGQVFLKAKFTVDPSKKPKTIDYTVLEGPNKDMKQLGIYELDGDTVKFCFAGPGQDRPKEFSTKAGDTRTLSTWKKDKK
jgi:uncharacterized protein (TIGR03067 family)